MPRFAITDGAAWAFSNDGINLTNGAIPAGVSFAHIWFNERTMLLALLLANAPNDLNVYRSTDGGVTWTQLAAALPRTHAHSALEHRATGAILVALEQAVGQPIQIARSTDGGASWATVTVDAAFTNARLNRRTLWEMADGSIIACPSSNLVAPRVYRSTNGGTTWSTVYIPAAAVTGRGSFMITVPHWSENVALLQWSTAIFGNTRLSRSTDHGATWSEVHTDGNETRSGIPPPGATEFQRHTARTPSGAYLYYSSPGGASLQWFRSTDLGATWTALVGSAFNQNTAFLAQSFNRLWVSNDPTVGARKFRGDTPDVHPGTWVQTVGLELVIAAYNGPLSASTSGKARRRMGGNPFLIR